jgi:small subunit ribosomal protein S29
MLLRPLLRRAAAASAVAGSGGVLPTARPDPPASLASLLLASRSYAKAKGGGKPAGSTSNRGKVRAKDPRGVASADDAAGEFASGVEDDGIDDEFELPTDPLPPTYNPALDVGPGGRPLFAFTDTFGTFHHRNSNVYVDFTYVALLISRSPSPISVGSECAFPFDLMVASQ